MQIGAASVWFPSEPLTAPHSQRHPSSFERSAKAGPSPARVGSRGGRRSSFGSCSLQELVRLPLAEEPGLWQQDPSQTPRDGGAAGAYPTEVLGARPGWASWEGTSTSLREEL